MEEMAVKSSQVPWRFPLSPTLRDNDCFEQEQSDLFQNLEKLIASAVSICRLNGSLQCQIGGLITVIEELQRLLRYTFSGESRADISKIFIQFNKIRIALRLYNTVKHQFELILNDFND